MGKSPFPLLTINKVFEILRSEVEVPKRIDKLKSRLEKINNRIVLLVSDGVNWREAGKPKAATVHKRYSQTCLIAFSFPGM